VLLHSPGGDPNAAYRLSRLLTRHCGSYVVIIPEYAKSAATLFSLGASKIYFGESAELGPLDVQVDDSDRERQMSALEVVQSLDRLNSESMQIVDSMMNMLVMRTGKRIESLLPHVLKYATDLTRPIFDKVDTVSFTLHSRLLKIGEDYAVRLLKRKYGAGSENIAYALTRRYPDHGFVIDREEAESLGLEVTPISDILTEPISPSLRSCTKHTVIGILEEKKDEKQAKEIKKSSRESGVKPGPPAARSRNHRRASNRIGENGSS
jgi:hypothetical protein